MAPVDTNGVDSPVSVVGQYVGTILTFVLALAVVIYVVRLWRREGITWPLYVAVGGMMTCLLEPLFDHLYGLWFNEAGQWNLYTTFGSHQPVWVPAAYLAFYGGAAVIVARTVASRPTMRTVWQCYAGIVTMALVAEISYISVLGLYGYQDSQPFVVFGYPIFLAFTNAMSALIGGIVLYRLVPLLTTGLERIALMFVVPVVFAGELFGGGILYLSVRHGIEDPPMWLTHVAALTVVVVSASTVRLLGTLLVDPQARRRLLAAGPPERVVPAAEPATEPATERATASL